jgi:hypothetical protein
MAEALKILVIIQFGWFVDQPKIYLALWDRVLFEPPCARLAIYCDIAPGIRAQLQLSLFLAPVQSCFSKLLLLPDTA